MGFKNKNTGEIEHNWSWINENFESAKKFANNHCPFKILQRKRNQTVKDVSAYNPKEHSILKITAYEAHIEFAILWAKDSNRHVEAHPLAYDENPFDFYNKLEKGLMVLKKRIDNFQKISDKETLL